MWVFDELVDFERKRATGDKGKEEEEEKKGEREGKEKRSRGNK